MILAADRSKRGRCDGTEELGRKARRGFLAVIDLHLGGTSLHFSLENPRNERLTSDLLVREHEDND